MKKIENLLFYLSIIILIGLIIGGLFLEVRVQKRWDNYEQKVFAEYNIK